MLDGSLPHFPVHLSSITCHLFGDINVRLCDGFHMRTAGTVVHWSHVQVTTELFPVQHVQRPYPATDDRVTTNAVLAGFSLSRRSEVVMLFTIVSHDEQKVSSWQTSPKL